jgi:dnd system-associated protein 4
MSNRIRRDKKHDQLIDKLTKGDDAVFDEIWRLLVFAASLGISQNKRSPIVSADSGKAFPEAYLTPGCGPGFISLLTICDTSSSELLRTRDGNSAERIKIFEEYANAGLEIIHAEVSKSTSCLDAILTLSGVSEKRLGAANTSGLI